MIFWLWTRHQNLDQLLLTERKSHSNRLTDMSKRRVSVRAKSQSLSFLEVSPSKRRNLRKRSLPLTVPSAPTPTTSGPSSPGAQPSTAGADIDGCAEAFPEVEVSEYCCDDGGETQSGDELSAHAKRQQHLVDHWLEVRSQMVHAAVEFGIPTARDTCAMCEKPAAVICVECGPHSIYCNNCVESVHSVQNIFHMLQIWKVN